MFVGKQLEVGLAVLALLTGIIGATITIEGRYAKASEVRQELREYYERSLKLRILEIDLKPDKTPADQALRQYLQQELQKGAQ